ncbi:MAG: protease inhibitor I42 family protein [Candidatus Humimicrobiaceae bacterium]
MKPKNSEKLSGKSILKYFVICGFFILIILILSLAACSISSKPVFTEKQNNASIDIKSGDSFRIILKSNQTTGYGWKLSEKTDAKIIFLVSSDYETSSRDKDIAGAGGIETFTFQAAKPGQTKLILEYIRSWEEDSEPANIYSLDVNVN